MICLGMSREKLNKLSIYDGIFNVFTDMEMFYKYAFDELTTVLVITDDFINNFFRDLSLPDTIAEIQKVNSKPEIVLLGENIKYNIAGTYTIKTNWNIPTYISNLLANLYSIEKSILTDKNEHIFKDFKLCAFDSENMISYILANPKESMSFIHELLDVYKRSNIDSWGISNRASSLALENKSLTDKLSNAQKQCRISDDNYNTLKSMYDELIHKINFQYSIPYEDEGSCGFKPAFLNYERILYIKEISPVKYTQTMIYYLQNIMNTISNKHTRCLIIEKMGAYMLEPLYPDYTPHYRLTHGDLKNADILMVGYQKDIMLSILQNTVQNAYLIVWDRTGTSNLYVQNPRVKVLYTMSDLSDNKYFNYPDTNILSYDKSVKHISYISDFASMGVQEKLKSYSSLSVIKELIKALEV